ncbi:MAG: glycerophosphodiester phosphodiesterase [Chloroflexi bacterium]|nr:glycerophosphodiester phosphodiesterase [Chloroflexota bacterium]
MVAYVLVPWPMPPPRSFELVAHRGVHQTFPLTGLTNETCTGEIIYPPTHGFIENTIPSMQAAFANGATAVELDIHRTADGHLVVFHDWTLECRTNGSGVTNEQTLEYLRDLDIGYGYTANGGQTFPLRGKGAGMMPTLPEVLAAFPDQRFVIHNKDGGAATAGLLIELLATLPAERRDQLYYWGDQHDSVLRERTPEVQKYIFDAGEVRSCFADYLVRMLVTGTLSDACRQHVIGIPSGMLESIPGWPNLILARAHQAGARVFITDVDTEAQLDAVKHLPIDGVQTNRIEVIGPLLADKTRAGEAVHLNPPSPMPETGA